MDQRNAAQRLRDILELQYDLDWDTVVSVEFRAGTAVVEVRLPQSDNRECFGSVATHTFLFNTSGTESRKVGAPTPEQTDPESAFNEPVPRSLGQVAYEEYADKMGLSSVLGDTLPLWPHVRSDVQRGWEAAADAVRRSVTPPKAEETAPAPVLDPRQEGKTASVAAGAATDWASWNGLTTKNVTPAGQPKSERQQAEDDAFDRLNPPGC